MITFTHGNLLDAQAEALVNTVNTQGVMGKGIALMFKEAFRENFTSYASACKLGRVQIGRMFVTETKSLVGPKWIVNFPTKQHWRNPSRIEWIEQGLDDLKRVIAEKEIKSIALPPLGSGNGGLEWTEVKSRIVSALGALSGVAISVYEPTRQYQNVAKGVGAEKLTPVRALVAEMVRRYWILGFECTNLEIQKLAYFLERKLEDLGHSGLDLRFKPDRYGPYADRLRHVLDALDGSYLHCEKRLADAAPLDAIWFDDSKKQRVADYIAGPDGFPFAPALDAATKLIDGFESPFGLELLATVDWLISKEGVGRTVVEVKAGLGAWPSATPQAGSRKLRLFDDRAIGLALDRLAH